MLRNLVAKWLRFRNTPVPNRQTRSTSRRFRPAVETLEKRCTPTAATVHAAVWLDGDSSGGGQGILTSLAHAFGPNSFKIITNAQLDTPGFLKASGFNVLVVSRFGSSFGTSVYATGAANIKAYVGTANSPNQGGVAIFTNDASDNFFGSTSGDPFDPNLDKLFTNAVQFAANTGHGYIGEFNGAVMAMASNTAGFQALDREQRVRGGIDLCVNHARRSRAPRFRHCLRARRRAWDRRDRLRSLADRARPRRERLRRASRRN